MNLIVINGFISNDAEKMTPPTISSNFEDVSTIEEILEGYIEEVKDGFETIDEPRNEFDLEVRFLCEKEKSENGKDDTYSIKIESNTEDYKLVVGSVICVLHQLKNGEYSSVPKISLN